MVLTRWHHRWVQVARQICLCRLVDRLTLSSHLGRALNKHPVLTLNKHLLQALNRHLGLTLNPHLGQALNKHLALDQNRLQLTAPLVDLVCLLTASQSQLRRQGAFH